jgi:hypothetical protein
MANGVHQLSDYAGHKVVVSCACGISKQYDADEMLRRIGDTPMTDLLDRLGAALGCEKSGNLRWHGDIRASQCNLRYNLARMGGYRAGQEG